MSYTEQRLRERVAELERDGPQIERAREDGNIIMGSMRECLEDARMALAAEESIAEALREQVAELEKDAARFRALALYSTADKPGSVSDIAAANRFSDALADAADPKCPDDLRAIFDAAIDAAMKG